MDKAHFTFRLTYYTGTGGTELIANCLSVKLQRFGSVVIEKVTDGLIKDLSPFDRLILIFPIHSFNAPEAIYRWIKNTPTVHKLTASVISVSGGGEISPNTAGRLSCIKMLEKKGFDVSYENMLIMPSSCLIATKEILAVKLLQIMPEKVEKIVADITSDVRMRSKPFWFDKIFSYLGELEKPVAGLFGKHIRISGECNGCGWCVIHCPSANIIMKLDKPIFHNKCHLCLNCIYGCPRQALSAGLGKILVIKEGYNLTELQSKIGSIPKDVNIEEHAKGYIWSGVRRYLLEK